MRKKILPPPTSPPPDSAADFAKAGRAARPSVAEAAKVVSADCDGQRLDNYLAREMKGAPRALIYRLIRTGQVRVNGGRARPLCKLRAGDCLRIPDNVALSPPSRPPQSPPTLPVLFEDDYFLAVDKPPGMAAHGGSGVSFGVIENLRASRSDRFLELAHRLDKPTSGALLLAKKSSALKAAQALWRERKVRKEYQVFVFGEWNRRAAVIDLPLRRTRGIGGEVSADGRPAHTRTFLLKQFDGAALLRADIATGRTHQLRAHLSAVGLPIVGDDKYGDFTANRRRARNIRMLLHASLLSFTHPKTGAPLTIKSPLPPDFAAMQSRLQ